MSDDIGSINIRGLKQIEKALKGKLPTLRVGILSGAPRSGIKNGPNNATIGAFHEFGTREMPRRSWLRQPLMEQLDNELKRNGLLKPSTIKEVIKHGNITPWLKAVGISAVNVIHMAFDTAGFGKWAPWANPGYTNRTGKILMDTQQLRNAASAEVK